jgi:TctA family transporter
MIGAEGDLRVFFSNSLVGSITTLAIVLLLWPLISMMIGAGRRRARRFMQGTVEPRA